MSTRANVWSARSVCALLGLLALAGCHTAVLDPAGPVGAADRRILLDALAIMLAIAVPTILATLAFAWWFRASNTRARHLPTWSYSGRVELIVWSIPALVVFTQKRCAPSRATMPSSMTTPCSLSSNP